ncbi:MAG: PKD domain-containing protein [Dehalococcoidia bacterium]
MKRSLAGLAVVVAVVIAGIAVGTTGASAATAPQAVAGGPYSAYLGNSIQFDGAASSGTGPLSYAWTFGDGTSATGARPVKTYTTAGAFTVTLTVTDSAGNRSVAATTATVYSYGTATTSGCYLTAYGTVACNQTAASLLSGCYLTTSGYVCPQYGVAIPSWLASSAVYPSTLSGICADPNYRLTPWCLDL